ncbi:unnamed protein product [Cunninghamella blakesleeana]
MPPKKIIVDSVDPLIESSKSPITDIDDIKSFVTSQIQLLPLEVQKELIPLLPNCDQKHDTLLDAIKYNNIFWDRLNKWQLLLENKGFEKTRYAWTIKELKVLSWKDENYENYWGERLKSNLKNGQLKRKRDTIKVPGKKSKATPRLSPPLIKDDDSFIEEKGNDI